MMHRYGKWNGNVYIECVTCYNKLCIRISVFIGIETGKKKKKEKSVRGNHEWNEITVSFINIYSRATFFISFKHVKELKKRSTFLCNNYSL